MNTTIDTRAEASRLAHPDSPILTSCQEFIAMEAQARGLIDRMTATEDEPARDLALAPIHAQQERFLDELTAFRPQTLDGFRALLNALMADDPDLSRDFFDRAAGSGGADERITNAILRNLLELCAGPAAETCKVIG